MSGVLQSPDRKLAALQSNGSKLILLVDDSYAERLAIRSGIELLTGFRVCEASNGAEAILKVRELKPKPDLILMDLAMPIMNGLAASFVFKNQMPNIPVVVLTLYADAVSPHKRMLLGLRAVLDKTDGLSAVLACLRKVLKSD